jgi:phospholipase/carboxylesterase
MTAPPANTHCVDTGPALAAAGLVHRVCEPPPTFVGPRPAVVLLHGRGGDEDAMWPFARTLPRGCVVVAPRAPHPDPVLGGWAWVNRADWEWPDLARFDEAVAVVAGFLAALPGLYGTDPGRTFALGFSQGAATAFALALRRPAQLQGVASLVGFMPEYTPDGAARHPLSHLPVFMAAGQRDPLVPLTRARASAAALRSAGADLTYHEYDVGHKVSTAGSRDLALWWQAHVAG